MNHVEALRTGSGGRRLAVFVLAALALHAALLWLVDLPEKARQIPSRVPELRITIDPSDGREAMDEREPGTVTLPADLRARDVPEIPSASPEPSVQPGTPQRPGRSDTAPEDEPLERPWNPAPGGKSPVREFGDGPAVHRIFKPQRLVTAEPRPGWTRGIWRRSRVSRETRFDAVDGRRVWIRHYDNGDVQVCERQADDLLDQWDDHLPFTCER